MWASRRRGEEELVSFIWLSFFLFEKVWCFNQKIHLSTSSSVVAVVVVFFFSPSFLLCVAYLAIMKMIIVVFLCGCVSFLFVVCGRIATTATTATTTGVIREQFINTPKEIGACMPMMLQYVSQSQSQSQPGHWISSIDARDETHEKSSLKIGSYSTVSVAWWDERKRPKEETSRYFSLIQRVDETTVALESGYLSKVFDRLFLSIELRTLKRTVKRQHYFFDGMKSSSANQFHRRPKKRFTLDGFVTSQWPPTLCLLLSNQNSRIANNSRKSSRLEHTRKAKVE